MNTLAHFFIIIIYCHLLTDYDSNAVYDVYYCLLLKVICFINTLVPFIVTSFTCCLCHLPIYNNYLSLFFAIYLLFTKSSTC